MNFTLNDPGCINYFKTGTGWCWESVQHAHPSAAVHLLPGHQAALPMQAEHGWRDQGDNSLVNYPFFVDAGAHYWSVAVSWNRFECDDREGGGTVSSIHQVWVR